MLRQISILFLAAAVLFSSVGANVYELFCDCEHLHELSLFEQHHRCSNTPEKSGNKRAEKSGERAVKKVLHACCIKKMLVKHLQIGRKTGSTGKCGNERSSKNVHKKPCCDFKATYVQIDAKFHVFKGVKTEKGKKIRAFTPRKNLKKDTKFSENKASLAAFSEQPASEAQRLGSTSLVIMRVPFVSARGFYGRQLRVRLASFLC